MSEQKMIGIETHKRLIDGLTFEPPEFCVNCGKEMRAKEWSENSIGPYIFISLPIPGMCFYQCTSCSAIMGNIHAVSNLKKMQKGKIVRPDSRIILAS